MRERDATTDPSTTFPYLLTKINCNWPKGDRWCDWSDCRQRNGLDLCNVACYDVSNAHSWRVSGPQSFGDLRNGTWFELNKYAPSKVLPESMPHITARPSNISETIGNSFATCTQCKLVYHIRLSHSVNSHIALWWPCALLHSSKITLEMARSKYTEKYKMESVS